MSTSSIYNALGRNGDRVEIRIEPVSDGFDHLAVLQLRQQVFEREMGIPFDRRTSADGTTAFHLIARVESTDDPVAALSTVDTTGNHALHQAYGLRFDANARVGRYTQLAVLKPYRGLDIPMMLMLEAHRQFVAPGLFDHTWLMFDAERARSSFLCKMLAFTPGDEVILSEYGGSRALVRDEQTFRCGKAVQLAEQYLERVVDYFPVIVPAFQLDLASTQ